MDMFKHRQEALIESTTGGRRRRTTVMSMKLLATRKPARIHASAAKLLAA
jgi:hypothetical protein